MRNSLVDFKIILRADIQIQNLGDTGVNLVLFR